MTRQDILKEALDMANHNTFCYSRNYAMSEPKEGYEDKWKEEKEKADLLEAMIAEMPKSGWNNEKERKEYTRTFLGSVSTVSSDANKAGDTNRSIRHIEFIIRDTEQCGEHGSEDRRLFEIEYHTGIDWFVGKEGRYDIERHQRYEEDKDTTLKIEVRGTTITAIEWLEK